MRLRSLVPVLVVVLATAFAAHAGEGRTVVVGEGAYSVRAPRAWTVNSGGGVSAAMLSDKKDSDNVLLLSPPNPVMNAGQLIAMELTSLTQAGADIEVTDGQRDVFGGHERIRVYFTAPLDDGDFLMGLVYALTVDGYVIMAAATGPGRSYEAFAPVAEKILETIAVDDAILAAQGPAFKSNGEELREDAIRGLLGERYNEPGARERLLEYLDNKKFFDL